MAAMSPDQQMFLLEQIEKKKEILLGNLDESRHITRPNQRNVWNDLFELLREKDYGFTRNRHDDEANLKAQHPADYLRDHVWGRMKRRALSKWEKVQRNGCLEEGRTWKEWETKVLHIMGIAHNPHTLGHNLADMDTEGTTPSILKTEMGIEDEEESYEERFTCHIPQSPHREIVKCNPTPNLPFSSALPASTHSTHTPTTHSEDRQQNLRKRPATESSNNLNEFPERERKKQKLEIEKAELTNLNLRLDAVKKAMDIYAACGPMGIPIPTDITQLLNIPHHPNHTH